MDISKEILSRIKNTLGKNDVNVHLHEPIFLNTNALNYVKNCLDTGWVSSSGKWVSRFENLISDFTGAKHVIAVSNGTVALRLALYLVGVRADDEVLIPPLSFVATANSISHLGANPHFIDIDKESLGMCPLALDKRLNEIAELKDNKLINKFTGKKIAAVVPVHVFGLPAKVQEIKKICLKWNIPLIEDAAEALGSSILTDKKKIHCGSFGEIGIISFNGNKVITSGGGGALLTNNSKIAKLAKHISTTAKLDHPWEFFHDQLGWNDRLPNINAALGVSQIEHLEIRLKLKRDLHNKFLNSFEDFSGAEILKESKNCESNYWLITLRLLGNNPKKIREKILSDAHASKIFLRPSWKLLNELPMYRKSQCGDLFQSYNQSERLINLPSSPQLMAKD